MTGSSLLSDLVVWSAQVACIAIVGNLLPTLLRLDAPSIRYAYFRALLVICLLLPWVQGRQSAPSAPVSTDFSAVLIGVPANASTTVTQPVHWVGVIGTVLVVGIAIRGLWIALGLVRLARLRTAGAILPWQKEHDELQHLLGTRAEIRYLVNIGHPVTFGARRPVVLLPDSLRSQPLHVQRAVLSHELIHVQRRDWTWLVAEEIVRAVFWFHPGMWSLISRVQLAREEVVDELAVLATGSRRGYIDALAAFADDTPLAPAAAFARRRHLLRRMRLVSKGVPMSSTRIAWTCAAMALIVAVGGWYVIDAFPLRAAQDVQNGIGPMEKQARPITPENPIPRRTYSVDPVFPPEAAAIDADAMVTLMVTLDQFGRVAEIRRLNVGRFSSARASTTAPDAPELASAFDALVRSAADAVRQWTYDPPAEAPLSIRVTFAFPFNGKPQLIAHDGWSRAAPAYPAGFVPPPPPPPPSAPETTSLSWRDDGIRVGGNVRQPMKIKHVSPEYPDAAEAASVQGVVILEARIGGDGKVTHARVLRSVPLLDQAALDAVMQWEFQPTLLNGQPVPVMMTVTVQFTLT
ncbi:MAG TPA: M56 family metallopeptidase [Vicinamibacterales bacterium]|nr:M56 family metallopeptidase [Vicinamibacterales bacterium]